MQVQMKPGIFLDRARVGPEPFWVTGLNVRFDARTGALETMGLYGPVRDVNGLQLQLPNGEAYRTVFSTPSTTTGQVLFGSNVSLQLVDYDPASVPATGTRWRITDVTPAALPAATDVLAVPSAGRVEIPPVWWFDDQDDVVVGCRSNVATEPCYSWDRSTASDFVPLAGSPVGAVGGGIINRILVLLGCTSFSDPDPRPFMTIRWSDRFNFEDWTPTDVNVSGELQLEGGSRIIGGGVTGFGVVAWTDKRMALLTETGDPDSVFARRYIDGGRGLMSNKSWSEADGQVFWYDEHRVLNVFDGGRPRQVPNPMKRGTMERLDDAQMSRCYLVANPEFGEVVLHYPASGASDPDRQLVYNYLLDVWSLWSLDRTGFGRRNGVIRPWGVGRDGFIWQHELDASMPDGYLTGPPPPFPFAFAYPGLATVDASDVEPFDFFALGSVVTTGDEGERTWRMTRILADHIPSPAAGAEGDAFDVVLNGYGETTPVPAVGHLDQDWQAVAQGGDAVDLRVEGKGLQIGLYGRGVRTVFRYGAFDVTTGSGGVR